MLKKTRFSFVFMLSILIFNMLSNSSLTSSYSSDSSSETIFDSEKYTQIADSLYEQDPTNPTQILRYRLLAEKPELASNLPDLKRNPVQAEEENVGDTKGFYIIDSFVGGSYDYVLESATMLAKGDNCYVYVLDDVITSQGESSATTIANNWKNEFENKIYPNDILYFGSPDGTLGDIDGDSHVTVLLAFLDGGVAGYFDMRNEIVYQYSNQREMVYVDYSTTYGVLAHEFQHLIHYNYDVNERWWVDEGCAEFAKYLSGYDMYNNLTAFARDFFAHYPDDSLLYWNYYEEDGRNVRIDYGSAYMFIFYVAEKYGYDAVKNIVSQTSVGAGGVETALSISGHSIVFNDLFLNWATALYVDDPTFGGGLYGFENLNISMDYDLISTFPAIKENRLNRFYGIYATKLSSPGDMLILDTASTAGKHLGISIAVHDINGWTVVKSLQIGSINDIINGTLIDVAYLITSVMDSTTPYVDSSAQFTVGLEYYVDFTLTLGQGLFIDSHTFSYEQSTWDFSLTNVVVLDENDTEIDDSYDIGVYAQFRYEDSSIIYKSLEMNYSVSLDWYLNQSLQSFDEDTYDLFVVASGLSQYGWEEVSQLTISHILSVEKPVVTLNTESTGLYVSVNASYTQLNGWEIFTENAQTMILLYDDEGTTVNSFSISFNDISNNWGIAYVDLSKVKGEHYIKVSFRYADRTVRSPESDHFVAEGVPDDTKPGFTSFSPWFLVILAVCLVSLPIIKTRLRNR